MQKGRVPTGVPGGGARGRHGGGTRGPGHAQRGPRGTGRGRAEGRAGPGRDAARRRGGGSGREHARGVGRQAGGGEGDGRDPGDPGQRQREAREGRGLRPGLGLLQRGASRRRAPGRVRRSSAAPRCPRTSRCSARPKQALDGERPGFAVMPKVQAPVQTRLPQAVARGAQAAPILNAPAGGPAAGPQRVQLTAPPAPAAAQAPAPAQVQTARRGWQAPPQAAQPRAAPRPGEGGGRVGVLPAAGRRRQGGRGGAGAGAAAPRRQLARQPRAERA